jgi:hypothetical protein
MQARTQNGVMQMILAASRRIVLGAAGHGRPLGSNKVLFTNTNSIRCVQKEWLKIHSVIL